MDDFEKFENLSLMDAAPSAHVSVFVNSLRG